MATRVATIALLLAVVTTVASAQTLRGKAVQPSDGAGIAGVLVILVDSIGKVAARALTDEDGGYRVSAPDAGRYSVRTLRIGYQPAHIAAVELGAGADLEQQLELTNIPLTLDTLRVLARARCLPYQGLSSIASAWEQARTAFTAADLTSRDRVLHATVIRVQRVLDPQSRRSPQETSTQSSGLVTKPWGTLPPDSLRRFGYVYRLADGSAKYYAPDIDALLSDNFVQDHCFRFASGPDSVLGVAFEPTRDRRDIPEIAGTVWLDRRSAELRRMEFRYVNLARSRYNVATDANAAGGVMDFVRMTNGGWVISNWEIRVPTLGQRARKGLTEASPYEAPNVETYVRQLHVERGVLTLVTRGQKGDTLWRIK